jgi:hypothetical protein
MCRTPSAGHGWPVRVGVAHIRPPTEEAADRRRRRAAAVEGVEGMNRRRVPREGAEADTRRVTTRAAQKAVGSPRAAVDRSSATFHCGEAELVALPYPRTGFTGATDSSRRSYLFVA